MRILKRILLLSCILLLCMPIGGVYALWNYYQPLEPTLTNSLVGLVGFYYKTEEVLPSDKANQMNAYGLVEYTINNSKIGLNSSKGDRLLEQVEEVDDFQLHSKDGIKASNLKHIFEDSASQAMEFTLEYISDTQICVYVYMDSDIEDAEEFYQSGVDIVRIPVYKTLVVRSKAGARDWDDVGTAEGYATVVRRGGFYAIDASTWAGKSEGRSNENV